MNVNWTQIKSRKEENKNEIKIKSVAPTARAAAAPLAALSSESRNRRR